MTDTTVKYEDHFGDDLKVVNAAKVSFDKRSEWIYTETESSPELSKTLSAGDIRLIEFLARGCTKAEWDEIIDEILLECDDYETAERILNRVKKMPIHFTPFTHNGITLIETVPIFVARQRFKHMIGFTYNEISRRYVDDTPEFFKPKTWRARAANKKQGSDYRKNVDILIGRYRLNDKNEVVDITVNEAYEEHIKASENLYNAMLASGIAPEQARMVLPQSMMTSYYVTGSLFAFARAYNQRSDRNHAQGEIADLADGWDRIIRPLFPVSWAALTAK
jgi:thymidylate synthase (FAD)